MPGEVFLNRYEIVRPLGEGGMGMVFLARQIDNGTSVVIKVMHAHIAAASRFRDNFEREAHLMASFRHPHAVALYEASLEDPRRPCLVMEYVPGETLEALIDRQGPLEPLRVGRLLGQLCSVLGAAHRAGMLHRDLSAANMMIVAANSPEETLKVMDFGLARVAGAGPHFSLEKLTGDRQGLGGGTPDYVCPEQIRKEEVDQRGDLYSVGVLLFKMLTGKLPFQDVETVDEILLAHVNRQPPTFAAVGVTSVPPAIEAVVQACLAKQPRERPQTARELGERFERALGTKILLEEEPAALPAAALPARPRIKPQELVDYLEAWMPESIAVVKLRGFAEDNGGLITDSEPGLVRVRLRRPPTGAPPSGGFLAWLGIGRQAQPAAQFAIMELLLEKVPTASNQLKISVVMRPADPAEDATTAEWKEWRARIARELRAYLIGRLASAR